MYRTKNTFNDDKNFGESYERLATNYVENNKIIFSEGNEPKYDFIATYQGVDKKYEVKADKMCLYTGNIAIEYECSGRPSGINSSEADYYIIFALNKQDSHKCYMIPLTELRELAVKCQSRSGGYQFRSKMYLLPLNNIRNYEVKPVNE